MVSETEAKERAKKGLPGPLSMAMCMVALMVSTTTAIMLVWLQRGSADWGPVFMFGGPALFLQIVLSRWYDRLWRQYSALCGAITVYRNMAAEIDQLRKALAVAEHKNGIIKSR